MNRGASTDWNETSASLGSCDGGAAFGSLSSAEIPFWWDCHQSRACRGDQFGASAQAWSASARLVGSG